jgi:hypothetical protein
MKHNTARSRAVVNKDMYWRTHHKREMFHGTRAGHSEYRRSWAGQRERYWRRAWCAAKERPGVRRLFVSFCSPFQVRRQELHARDCILQAPYTVSSQVLRDHHKERNIELFTYVRPYHAHLDHAGDLARLRVRGRAVAVKEVLLATQNGICGPDVHMHHPILDSRRP